MEYVNLLLLGFIAFCVWSIARQIDALRIDNVKKDFMRYPLYTHQELQEALNDAQNAQKALTNENAVTMEMQKEEDKVKNHKDFSDKYKSQVHSNFKKRVKADRKWKSYYSMIEGNVAILNGKKIKDVQNEYDDFMMMLEEIDEAEKNYQKWLAA